ncbi:MAG: hypothetical protein ACRDSG_11825 [Pseudonocardiaceae bacterium]
MNLDPQASETEAFEDLYRFLRWRADPDRRVASESELVGRVGAWIGSAALGEQVGRAIVAAAPVTVRVQVPAGAEFLAFRPWELAHVGGVPLAARGDVALVYDLPGPAGVVRGGAPPTFRTGDRSQNGGGQMPARRRKYTVSTRHSATRPRKRSTTST